MFASNREGSALKDKLKLFSLVFYAVILFVVLLLSLVAVWFGSRKNVCTTWRRFMLQIGEENFGLI